MTARKYGDHWEVTEGRRCWRVFAGTKLSPERLNGAIIFNERGQQINPDGQLGTRIVNSVEAVIARQQKITYNRAQAYSRR